MHIHVQDVKKAYGLKGVSFSVDAGGLVAIVGSNGSGKTTLLRTMAGLNAIKSGQIDYDGELFSRQRIDLLRDIHLALRYSTGDNRKLYRTQWAMTHFVV